jgi:hypothetical protein
VTELVPPAGADATPAGGLLGFEGRVVYLNGRAPDAFTAGPAVVSAWELYALRNGYPVRGASVPALLMSLVVAFEAIGEGPEGFETWRRTVHTVELNAVNVPPTRPDPSAV